MFSRKVPNTVLNNNPNLKAAILLTNSTTKRYFFRYNFTIHEVTVSDIVNNVRNVRDRMRVFVRNGMVLHKLHDAVLTVPRTLKNQSTGALRVWAHQCECVLAQRLRRGQQMFCLYTKLWEERALKELLTRMRQQITRRGKELMFSAIGVSAYNWDKNRISNDEITKHINELEYIHMLTEKTVICDVCKQEQTAKKSAYCECASKNPQTKSFDSWVPFIEKQDMLVWRRLHDSGHYEYKVYGSFNDVSAEDFLNVQIDSIYRKKWDTTAITLEVVEKDPAPQSNSDIVYWEMLWPKLFVNRDYVFNRRFMIDNRNKTIIMVSRGTKHPACPIKPDKYRVDNYWSYMVIKPYTDLDKPGIEFGLTYFDNPGVNIPSAVTTWVAMRAMPDFLARLREATREYKTYCKESGNKCVYSVHDKHEEQKDDAFTQSAKKTIKGASRTWPDPAKEPASSKAFDTGSKTPTATPGTEIMTSPSPTIQAESDKHNYWKYLRPNYYFS